MSLTTEEGAALETMLIRSGLVEAVDDYKVLDLSNFDLELPGAKTEAFEQEAEEKKPVEEPAQQSDEKAPTKTANIPPPPASPQTPVATILRMEPDIRLSRRLLPPDMPALSLVKGLVPAEWKRPHSAKWSQSEDKSHLTLVIK